MLLINILYFKPAALDGAQRGWGVGSELRTCAGVRGSTTSPIPPPPWVISYAVLVKISLLLSADSDTTVNIFLSIGGIPRTHYTGTYAPYTHLNH